jgi:hypothetical protein
MNPEFRRQLWLHASLERFVATPFVVALIFTVVGVGSKWQSDSLTTCALCVAAWSSGMLGGAAATESLASEARARTWDWQRLSGLGPWQMTWEKLCVSTLTANYAACLAYAGLWAWGGQNPAAPRALVVALGLVMGALVQSTGMLVAAWQIVSRRPQAAPAASYLLGAGASGLMLLVLIYGALTRHPYPPLHWFGLSCSRGEFRLVSACVFLGWSVLGNYRVMRSELVGPSAPWLPLVLALFLSCYVVGLVEPSWGAPERSIDSVRLFAAESVIAAVAYASCLLGTMRPVEMKRWWLTLRGDRRLAWQQTPVWIACVALTLGAGSWVRHGLAAWSSRGDRLPPLALPCRCSWCETQVFCWRCGSVAGRSRAMGGCWCLPSAYTASRPPSPRASTLPDCARSLRWIKPGAGTPYRS